MAARISQQEHAEILKMYSDGESLQRIAKRLNRSVAGVRKHVMANEMESNQKCMEKRSENIQSVLQYMDSRKDTVCDLIDKSLEVCNLILSALPELIESEPEKCVKYLSMVVNSMATIIDKFTMNENRQPGMSENNNLFEAIERSCNLPIDFSEIPELALV